MPGQSGFDFCRTIRESSEWGAVPVIFLTSKDQDADKILGLELGGDDYITKPFSVGELLARIRAVLRRRGGNSDPEGILQSGPVTWTPTSNA